MDYREELKSREWKIKRERILARDNRRCQICGASEHLHVHHILYVSRTRPQDYPDFILITLCNKCHSEEHHFQKIIENLLKYMRSCGLSSKEIYKIFFEHLEDENFKEFNEGINIINERRNKRF